MLAEQNCSSELRADLPEEIIPVQDSSSGLDGVIVIHSTVLGPAVGGCRMWHYESFVEAEIDAMRLAQGMSYKNALAGLPFGGGKTVLRMPRGSFDRRALFQALGRELQRLGGRYITAEDVGTSLADMEIVAGITPHVGGLEARDGRVGGDPSPWTALGVFTALKTAAERRLGKPVSDLTIAVQGLGHVGYALCGLLHEEGANLIVSDLRETVTEEVARRFGAKAVPTSEIIAADADVFAPCALGAVLSAQSIDQLRARVICGGANNQLSAPAIGAELVARNILYAPDYLVNAGGIIHVAAERLGWPAETARTRIEHIGTRLTEIFDLAEEQSIPTNIAADELARATIARAASTSE